MALSTDTHQWAALALISAHMRPEEADLMKGIRALWAQILAVGLVFSMVFSVGTVLSNEHNDTKVVRILVDKAEQSKLVAKLGIPVLVRYDSFFLGKISKSQELQLREEGMQFQEVGDLTLINLPHSGIKFDTTTGEPQLPADLTISESNYYIVQFIGPVKSEWVQHLASSGAIVHDYIHNFAFVAKMDSSTRRMIEGFPEVRWVGLYQPAYKISTKLDNRYGILPIEIFVFEGEDVYLTSKQVESLGGKVVHVQKLEGMQSIIKAKVDSTLLPSIAKLPSISFIYYDEEEKVLSDRAGRLLKAHDAWYADSSGYVLEAGTNVGLTGKGQIIGITDTGFDRGSATTGMYDFFRGPLGDRVIRVAYDGGGTGDPDDEDGHGTLVAGLALGNGYCRERFLGEITTDREYHKGFAGIAPEASLSFSASWGTFGGLQINVPTQWNNQYNDGARQLSNSWGGGDDGSYGSTSVAADSWMWQSSPNRRDALLVIAAGNGGPAVNSISSPGTAKNPITIGATGNDRLDEEKFPTDPNKLADFSARGPTDGSRGKPDVVAPGESVASTKSTIATLDEPYDDIVGDFCPDTVDGRTDYEWFAGTSASTPLAAGAAAIVRQYYINVKGIPSQFVNSTLVKATLINGAVDMGYGYPWNQIAPGEGFAWSYDQGWGRIDLKNSLFPAPPRANKFAQGTVTTGQTWDASIDGGLELDVRSARVPLKITLVWLDTSGMLLNNNLDLRVISPTGKEYHGNQFTNNWADETKTGYDVYNNVENVFIKEPESGVYQVKVVGTNVPGTPSPPFGLIVSADFGGEQLYQLDLSPRTSTIMSGVAGGSTSFQFNVLNFGTNSDSIALSHNAPGGPSGFTISFNPTSPLSLAPNADVNVSMMIQINSPASGVYNIRLKGTSQNDTLEPIAQDYIDLIVEVLTESIPRKIRVTNGQWYEGDPSILTYSDGTDDHIWISYLSEELGTNGKRVFVKHSTWARLMANEEDWDKVQVSDLAEGPDDPRIYKLSNERIVVFWHGVRPSDDHSITRLSYSDPPYTIWTKDVLVDDNFGPWTNNVKRRSFLVEHGTRLYAFMEILGYDAFGSTANFLGTDIIWRYSTNNGESWPTAGFVGDGTATNIEFFPTGIRDRLGKLWIIFYIRVSDTDRDIWYRTLTSAFVWEAAVLMPEDYAGNDQFPAAWVTSEGPSGNRVYVAWLSERYTTERDWFRIARKYTNDQGTTWAGVNAAGYGSEVSQSGYVSGQDLLVAEQTSDGYSWISYLEADNVYDVLQIHVAYSNDGFSTANYYKVTADAYGKGHQTIDSIGTNIYETYHSYSADNNMDVWLTRYNLTKANGLVPDTEGPIATDVAVDKNNVTQGSSIFLTANIDDTSTGFSNIASAEYYWDSDPGKGLGIAMDPADGNFNTPVEATKASVSTSGLSLGWHILSVRGRDSIGNWGSSRSAAVYVRGGVGPVAPILQSATLGGIDFADVTITWAKSTDEGQAGGTVKYAIYRSTNINGPWSFIGEVQGVGSPTYSFTDFGAGDGDINNYFYYVQSNDSAGNSAWRGKAGKFTIYLSAGKQLVSIPLIQADTRLEKVLQTLSFNMVRYYDASDSIGPWKAYMTFKTLNDLKNVDHKMALWINVTSNDYLTVAGLVPQSTTINLYKGWNFVGYPSFSTAYTVGDLKSQTGATRVEGYDPNAPPYYLKVLPDSYVLRPGEGYWIRVSTGMSWILSN